MITVIKPVGEHAALVELTGAHGVYELHAALRQRPPAGMTELVPAARTILIGYDPARTSFARLASVVRELRPSGVATNAGRLVEIPVRYDGPDLDDVARCTGLGHDEVARRHAACEYVVAFCGFAPGFAYLGGGDPALRVPRRAVPRTRVPAGAVAVADEFSAVYPAESPGGWQVLGRTESRMWDLTRDPPALLAPGDRVRFAAVSR